MRIIRAGFMLLLLAIGMMLIGDALKDTTTPLPLSGTPSGRRRVHLQGPMLDRATLGLESPSDTAE